jgi:hypothetical protein
MIQSASGAAPGARGRLGDVRGEVAHLTGLDPAAELLPEFMRAGLDHRVMRDAYDGALRVVQGHGDFRGFAQELIELLLECSRRPIHGSTLSMPRSDPPKFHGFALYHRIPEVSY